MGLTDRGAQPSGRFWDRDEMDVVGIRQYAQISTWDAPHHCPINSR
jgi:hypothetical protein